MHVYMSIRPLPASCQPCHLTRAHGLTMLVVHPGADRSAVVLWCRERLTTQERRQYRRAFGLDPKNDTLPDSFFDTPLVVPPSLLTVAGRRQRDADWLRLTG